MRADGVDRRERGRARPRDQEHASDGLDERGAVHVGQRGSGGGDPVLLDPRTGRPGRGASSVRCRSATSATRRRCRRRRASRVWRRRPTWQAPAQNWRRETSVFVSDIGDPREGEVSVGVRQYQGHAQTTSFFESAAGVGRADHKLRRATGDFVNRCDGQVRALTRRAGLSRRPR